MKRQVLFLAIALVTVFSLYVFSPGIGEDTGHLSSIDASRIADGGYANTGAGNGSILILGAFGQEIDGVRRNLEVEEAVAEPGYELYRGTYGNMDILLVRTGMGKERAERATRSVLDSYPVAAIVSLGFAGGLNPELEIGDVVLCSTLYYANGTDPQASKAEPYASDASLIALASDVLEEIEVSGRVGSSVTVLELDSDLQKQQYLAETFRADVVEMESYWIARIASDRGIPFVAIRSMSDRGNDIQPFDEILSPEGDLLWREAVVNFTIHPEYLVRVFTLYLHVRVAHGNLTACVLHLVTRM